MLKNKISVKTLIPFIEVFSKIISFINILLMMKFLSMSEYADYAYIVAIVLWAAVLMDGGINNLIFDKSLKNEIEEIDSLFSSRFILSVIVILFLGFYFAFKKPELTLSAILFSFVMLLNTCSVFIKLVARGKKIHDVDLITIISESILRLLVFGFVYFAFKGLDWRLWIFMLIYVFAGIISFYINLRALNHYVKLKLILNNINSIVNKIFETFKIAKFFLLYGIIYIGLSKIDIIFLEKYSSKNNLALFSSAMLIYEVILLFFFTIITSHFKEIYFNQKKNLLFISIFSLLIILITILFSEPIFKFLLPENYFESYNILNHIIFGIFPSIFIFYFIFKLNFENLSKINLIILLIAILVKTTVYSVLKSGELTYYNYVFPTLEYFTFICYLVYFIIYRRKRIKKSKNIPNMIPV